MSTPLNITPLKKALSALQKCHDGITEGQERLRSMKKDYAEAMENTDPSDITAIRALGDLSIRIELMPKFIRKSMEERLSLATHLRGEIEPLWLNLEAALQKDRESFMDDHEKKISGIFGDRSREVLVYAPAFPKPNWGDGDRAQLGLLFEHCDHVEGVDQYERDSRYDQQLCRIAENLLKITAAYQPYKKA